MDRINSSMTRLVWGLQERLSQLRGKLERADGIEAMEYLVMMIGLVLLIYAAYSFAGAEISRRVVSFFNGL